MISNLCLIFKKKNRKNFSKVKKMKNMFKMIKHIIYCKIKN